MTLKDYMNLIEDKLNCSGVISINNTDNLVSSAFVQGGAFDESSIPAVKASGASVVVSGEIKHHITLLLAHMGILSVIAGHNATERIFMENLRGVLSERFPDVTFLYEPGPEKALL